METGSHSLVSLFSGCGGMDLAFLQSGFNIIWACDVDKNACLTYRKNIGGHIHNVDLRDIDKRKIPDSDIVTGGFPCQDFSTIGRRRGLKGERGPVYLEFVETVDKKKPYIFLGENVRGILTSNKGKDLEKIIEDFSEAGEGYRIYLYLVNFAYFGVSQIRYRVLFLGVRRDIKSYFIPPSPTHPRFHFVPSGVAFKNVHLAKYNNEIPDHEEKTIKRLELIPEGGNQKDIPRGHPLYVDGWNHRYRRLHSQKPSNTITKGGGFHYKHNRKLTCRELARLSSYPDSFVFEGTMGSVRQQIANSVPPLGLLPWSLQLKKFLDEIKKEKKGDGVDGENKRNIV